MTGLSAAENVKKLREQRGWSQVRLAMEAHVSQQSISFIERGRNEPSAEMIRALAKALGVSSSDIIDGSVDESHAASRKEIQLLEIFHQLNAAGQDFLLAQADQILRQEPFRQEGYISSAI